MNLGSNARVIVGGLPWSEIKEKKKDPSWDKASFWKSLSTHDQNLMLKLIDEDSRSQRTEREGKNVGLRGENIEGIDNEEASLSKFSKQLTDLKRNMVDNRRNISQMLTEVNNFRYGMIKEVQD